MKTLGDFIILTLAVALALIMMLFGIFPLLTLMLMAFVFVAGIALSPELAALSVVPLSMAVVILVILPGKE